MADYSETWEIDSTGTYAIGLELPEWVHRTGHADAQITPDADGHHLPPVLVYRHLLGFSGLSGVVRSVALWLTTWVGGAAKSHDVGQVRGSRLHAYPKVAQIAERSGFAEKTVRRALIALEADGWLVVDRFKNAPSDYWLAVPDVDLCPCGCETGGDDTLCTPRATGHALPERPLCTPRATALHSQSDLRTCSITCSNQEFIPLASVENDGRAAKTTSDDDNADEQGRVEVEWEAPSARTDPTSVIVDAAKNLRAMVAMVDTDEDRDLAYQAWRRGLEARGWDEHTIRAATRHYLNEESAA